MDFNIPQPDQRTIEAMHNTWSRHRLEPYLVRWQHARVPEVPSAFMEYTWRACDVGCGLGRFLLAESEHYPERGYLGIDKGVLRGGSMVQRFLSRGNPNLFGIHGNAIPVLAGMPDASLDLITIFYPNPWWPAKHRKKRWSYHPLLPKLVALLKPGGTLLLTSNEGFYLGEWCYAMTHHPEIAKMEREYAGPVHVHAGRSHFEVKFLAEGTPIGETRFRKP